MPGFYCKATMAAPRSYAVLKRKTLLLLLLAPVLAASIAYQLDQFDPAPMPVHEFSRTPVTASLRNNRMLQGAEYVGFGQLPGPEDIAYHRESQLIYTGCRDGWVKQVPVNESVGQSVVKEWVNTGGRPLGLAFGRNNEVIVADAYKGLLNLSRDGEVELLTEEADGVKFRLTDAVDVAENGLIYFTDASYKYNFETYIFDLLEGKPHGRFMSFDPHTRKTKVLLRDLYFANGVAVSPNQDHVIFCETPMRRCRRYYIKGNKKGRVEKFIDNLPGLPDNVRYDGQGHYWIGLAVGVDWSWNLGTRYPFLRKVMAILEKCKWLPNISKNGGVLAVDLDGKPVAHYYDIGLSLVSSGIKIANHLYCGSLYYPYILRLNLEKHPAQSIY